jgi:hypothetical protein
MKLNNYSNVDPHTPPGILKFPKILDVDEKNSTIIHTAQESLEELISQDPNQINQEISYNYNITDFFSKTSDEIYETICEKHDKPKLTYPRQKTFNPLESKLEDFQTTPQTKTPTYLSIRNLKSTPKHISHDNSRSGARVIYVTPDALPSGNDWRALGAYDPATHMIYIANNLNPQLEEFVYAHEEAHSLGIESEIIADIYAASKTGFLLERDYSQLQRAA